MLKIRDPLRDIQQEKPVCHCKRCGQEIYHDCPVVTEDGGRMHMDCFEEYVEELLKTSPAIVADCLGMRYEEAY